MRYLFFVLCGVLAMAWYSVADVQHNHKPIVNQEDSQNLSDFPMVRMVENPLLNSKGTIPVISLDSAIDAKTALLFSLAMEKAESKNPKVIVVEIDSPGGFVNSGMIITKLIEQSKAPVVCVVDGMAASMAYYILQSCDTRLMTDRSMLMIHDPHTSAGDGPLTLPDLKNLSRRLELLVKTMRKWFVHRLKITPAELDKHLDGSQDWWMDSEESLKIGAVDGVVTSLGSALRTLQKL